MAIRYADDLVVGFERRDEAERFLKEFGERLAKFGLELHPEKTRRSEFGAVSGEGRPLLGPGFRPALTNWESLCHPTRSSFQTLATSSQGGASLPGAAFCRYPSKVRAVCVNRARTDPCGGCEATRIPTATSLFDPVTPAKPRWPAGAGWVTDDKSRSSVPPLTFDLPPLT